MKKVLSLILALAMCLSLCACGGKDAPEATEAAEATTEVTEPEVILLSKDEIMATAVEIDNYEAEFIGNKLRAEEKYIGNNYIVTGNVAAIDSDHIEIQPIVDNVICFGHLSVELPKEEIMELTTGQKVQIAAQFSSFTEEEMDMGYGFTETVYNGIMTNGYIISDKFEVSGLLRMYYIDYRDIDGRVHHQYGDESKWSIGLDVTDDNVLAVNFSLKGEIPVDHVAGENITSVQFGGQEIANETNITVYARIIGGDLVDAELVSIE